MVRTKLPTYRLHNPSGQAFVELNGRRIYLGKYGSKASKARYDTEIAQWIANGRQLPPIAQNAELTGAELAVRFLDWAAGLLHYPPRSESI